MELLFLNALKGLKNHKLQMFSIISLIILSTGIYTMMKTSLDRIEDRYYEYLKEQKVEDFSFVTNIDYEKDFTSQEVLNYLETDLKNLRDEDKNYVYLYSTCLKTKTDICSVSLYTKINSIFMDNGIILLKDKENLDILSKKYDFTYQITSSKTYMANGIATKIIPYQEMGLNIPYLLEGSFPKNDNEITILKGFAKASNLNIGDTYTIDNKSYKIVGFSYASDYIYPMISINIPIFDEKKNNIIFMTNNSYNEFNSSKEIVYSAKFNYETDPKSRMKIELIENEDKVLTAKTNNPASDFFVDEQDKVTRSLETISRSIRIDTMQLEFKTTKLFAEYFLYLLLTISIIIIIIINKKRIENERLQIGVLNSLGYKKVSIAISYLVYPIIGSLVGGFIGYFIGFLTNDLLAQVYLSYFNVVLTNSVINITYLKECVLVPFVMLSILSFIISLFMLRKKPLELLKEGSNLKVNFLTKIVNKITAKMKFERKFRLSLASRSIGKLLIVSITSFATGLLITLCLIGSNLFGNLIDESFSGYKFNYMVGYNKVFEEITDNDDYILQVNSSIKRVEDKNNKVKQELKDNNITIYGVDSSLKYLDIKSLDNKNLINYLTDKTIIINSNISDLYNIVVGDYVVFEINEKYFSFEVVGIENSYISDISYVKRSNLSEVLGFSNDVYNMKYSNNNKYSNITSLDKQEVDSISMVFSLKDLKNNITSQMEVYNDSLYIIITFAALISLIIILVIANIIVEENKKTISLMKVMGYENDKISKIVLNIYTPFIIIFYLISVPVMKKILEEIIKVISDDMEMSIPINVSFTQVLLGLIVLLIIYFIAMMISKKSLNKVPLSIALKRE